MALAAVECRVECWAAAESARVGPEEGQEEVLEVGEGWVVEDTSVPLTGMVIPGLLTNSILFYRLFLITDRCKKVCLQKMHNQGFCASCSLTVYWDIHA